MEDSTFGYKIETNISKWILRIRQHQEFKNVTVDIYLWREAVIFFGYCDTLFIPKKIERDDERLGMNRTLRQKTKQKRKEGTPIAFVFNITVFMNLVIKFNLLVVYLQ